MKSNELRRRLLRSLLTGAVLFSAGIAGFVAVRHGPPIDEAPTLLRKFFHFNEKLGTALHSNERLSVAKPKPPAGSRFRVNGDLGLLSGVDLDRHRVQLESGTRSLEFTVGELKALPKANYSTDFRCIEGWTQVMDYSGLRFSEFMKAYQVGTKPDGSYYRYVALETPDREYYVSVDMESMLHPQTLLAYEMSERPLTENHGAPLRLVIPIKYGIKSLKRIGRIYFSDERPPDYWAERGYDWFSGL